MRNYSKAAVDAYQLITTKNIEPAVAWKAAISSVTPSDSARKKGCPRETFLGLAYAGYLREVNPDPNARSTGVLRERAVSAANALLAQPGIGEKELSILLGYTDKQGAYDIVIELSKREILQKPKNE